MRRYLGADLASMSIDDGRRAVRLACAVRDVDVDTMRAAIVRALSD